jgi:hypothetical protein
MLELEKSNTVYDCNTSIDDEGGYTLNFYWSRARTRRNYD